MAKKAKKVSSTRTAKASRGEPKIKFPIGTVFKYPGALDLKVVDVDNVTFANDIVYSIRSSATTGEPWLVSESWLASGQFGKASKPKNSSNSNVEAAFAKCIAQVGSEHAREMLSVGVTRRYVGESLAEWVLENHVDDSDLSLNEMNDLFKKLKKYFQQIYG